MKISSKKLNIAEFQDKSLLIVDDDDPFRNRLGRAMENKGFKPFLAKSVEEAIIMVKKAPPAFAAMRLASFRWKWIRCSSRNPQIET